MRINELDDNETDHIEVDLVMDFYIQDYRSLRNINKSKIHKAMIEMNKNN